MTAYDPIPYRSRRDLGQMIEREQTDTYRRLQREREERAYQTLRRALWLVALVAALIWALGGVL